MWDKYGDLLLEAEIRLLREYICKRCKDTFECRDMENFIYCEECERDLDEE